MGILTAFEFKFNKGDLDTGGRELQQLDSIHRATLMANVRGKPQAGQSHFLDPIGQAGYFGFGADGWHYEGGVQGRLWRERESIDDFADLVTDIERWQPIGVDLTEGGMDFVGTPPFGKRLHAAYVGPAPEIYERKGKMVRLWGSTPEAALSCRVNCDPVPGVIDLDNSILLGIQQLASDVDFVFVGFVNSATFPFSVVMGQMVGGIFIVTGAVPIPPTTPWVDLSIRIQDGPMTYMGEFSLAGTDADEGGGPWAPIGPPVPMPPGWPSAGVPRISTFFPAGHPPVTEHRMTDVRVAANGGVWEGQQRATWWLETQDVTNPLNLSGVQAECPGELLVTWERDATGICHLTLVDTDDPSDPTVWRRWQNLGNWADWDRVTEYPWWSPGWLDADEGHIVMTRNTRALVPGSVPEDIRGEVWLVSLRWDKIVVFNADGLGTVVGSYNSTTGEIIRETGSWGSRRWIAQNTYQLLTGYDTKSIAKPVSPALPFVGTFANLESESLIPAVTYGVSIRRAEDDVVYLAYGVQRLPPTPYTSGEYGAGVIVLGEGPVFAKFDRTLFRKDTSSYDVWDETDEVWTAVGLSYYRALWWTQGGELGAFDEIEGVLCRTYFPPFAPNNDSVATYPEDSFWVDTNLFENRGLNLAVLDTTTIHEEIVFVASGWISGSHLTVLWHNPSTPALSVTKTFGPELSTEPVTHDLHVTIPSNEFPRWLPFLFQRSDVDLKRCRITGAGGRGADSFYAMEDGIWSAYCQFEGCTAEEFEYQILRGSSIDKGNFTVEMEGKYNPPFAGGYGIQAYDRMAFGQTAQFSLGVVGEKRLRASIGLKVRGNGLGTGGITIEAALEFMTGGGLVQHSASLPAVASQKNSGSFVKLRISRDAENWIFLYYNTELGDWVEVMNEFGHVLPVTPYLGASMADAVGLACAIGLEIDKITLAPFDDVTGQIFQRTVMYPTIPSVFGKIAGGVGVRELVPSSESGAIIIGDAWNFPGLMPRP